MKKIICATLNSKTAGRRLRNVKNALQRPVGLTDNIAKVCLVDNKQYLSVREASFFFAKPEMNSVQHDTYWAIFRHLRDVKGYDFLAKP